MRTQSIFVNRLGKLASRPKRTERRRARKHAVAAGEASQVCWMAENRKMVVLPPPPYGFMARISFQHKLKISRTN